MSSQRVQDPDGDTKDRSSSVPLRCVPRGRRDAPCRSGAREPEEKRGRSFKSLEKRRSRRCLTVSRPSERGRTGRPRPQKTGSARLCPVWSEPGRCLGREPAGVKRGAGNQAKTVWGRVSALCACGYLHRLIGRDPGSSDHERDPDVELVQLPLVDGQRELTWGQWDSGGEGGGSEAAVSRGRRGRRRRRSHLCGSRCPRWRRCRCCSARRRCPASSPASPPCRPRRPASATCGTGGGFQFFGAGGVSGPFTPTIRSWTSDLLFLPFPVGIVQIGERTGRHGVGRLTQQPVFVLRSQLKKKYKTHTPPLQKKGGINIHQARCQPDPPSQVCQSCRPGGLWRPQSLSGTAAPPSRGSGGPGGPASGRTGAGGSCCPGSWGSDSSERTNGKESGERQRSPFASIDFFSVVIWGFTERFKTFPVPSSSRASPPDRPTPDSCGSLPPSRSAEKSKLSARKLSPKQTNSYVTWAETWRDGGRQRERAKHLFPTDAGAPTLVQEPHSAKGRWGLTSGLHTAAAHLFPRAPAETGSCFSVLSPRLNAGRAAALHSRWGRSGSRVCSCPRASPLSRWRRASSCSTGSSPPAGGRRRRWRRRHGAKKKKKHVLRLWVSESHQRVPLVPAGRDMADIACVLLPVLIEGEIKSDWS